MKPWDFTNDINEQKKNVIRNNESPEAAEKLYSPFLTLRQLSYHSDCILLANELNTRSIQPYNIPKIQHFEFLLNIINRKRRFTKFEKPEGDEVLGLIQNAFGYNYDKAQQVASILTEEQLDELRASTQEGGAN